jgi:fructosamine-3-kinase
MDGALSDAIEAGLAARTGSAARVVAAREVGGGSIHTARIIELDDGRRLFVKSNAAAPAGMFESEAAGLAALREAAGAAAGSRGATAIVVPGETWVGETAGAGGGGAVRFLAMEAIDEGSADAGFFRRFGQALAELHRAARGERFGFEADNYIGATPQPNGWEDDWLEFFGRRRLGFQLDLARRSGRTDREIDRLGDRLLERLGEWLDLPGEPPCLIHGDLWSGNFLVAAGGAPALVDPAVHYAHREAELAMTRLFGGFDADFYAAYEETWPLAPGSGERQRIYALYHLLNHLNLFGAGYRAQCVATLRRLVG